MQRRLVSTLTVGSPPRGRGKAEQQAYEQLQSGITPAQAGKRRQSSHCLRPDRDHPRAGGEKTEYAKRLPPCQGLPPRRRGKVFLTDLVRVVVRITPAQAGKSRRCCLPGSPRRDHPRVGGEKAKANCRHFWPVGSPPRGRGKVVAFILAYVAVGITPAWAGKSRLNQRKNRWKQDHPRVGGEKYCSHN